MEEKEMQETKTELTEGVEKKEKDSEVLCAFTIGVKEDGKFVWDIYGIRPDIVTLQGLLMEAGKRIDLLRDDSQKGPFTFLNARLDKLFAWLSRSQS